MVQRYRAPKQPTVTLKKDGDLYVVTQIRGFEPAVTVWPEAGGSHKVRVGDILHEDQVTELGKFAELIVRA